MNDEVVEPAAARRRCKNRGPQLGLLGCASPRNIRRSRRRSEVEIREDRDLCLAEEFVKARKRKQSGRSKKEKLSLVPVPATPSSSTTPSKSKISLLSLFDVLEWFVFSLFWCGSLCIIELDNDENGSLDRIGQLITDLIMWKDAAKSSLWFGLGSLFFFSTCFTRGVSFRYGSLTWVIVNHYSFWRAFDHLITVLILMITAFSQQFPSLDFCVWVLHLSPIQSVKGTVSNQS